MFSYNYISNKNKNKNDVTKENIANKNYKVNITNNTSGVGRSFSFGYLNTYIRGGSLRNGRVTDTSSIYIYIYIYIYIHILDACVR